MGLPICDSKNWPHYQFYTLFQSLPSPLPRDGSETGWDCPDQWNVAGIERPWVTSRASNLEGSTALPGSLGMLPLEPGRHVEL